MSPRRVIYLDNAATTAVDPRVIAVMNECLGEAGDYANPSSATHAPGRAAGARIERARAEVAALVNASPEQILFTSGATEANNLALLGVARFNANSGRHIVTSRTEHPAVLDACRHLEREGFAVTYVQPGEGGVVDPEIVAAALRSETLLVSVMHVNNEIGVVNDVRAIGYLCRERGVLLHVDAAQSAGKVPLDVQADAIDLLSLTAHKLHGPKGVGALCVRREPRLGLVPLQFGGGQERGLRSGTLPTHQIAGMGEACRIARAQMAEDIPRIVALRTRLWEALAELPGVLLNGDPTRRVAGILNVAIDGVEGESLLFALADLALSSGSACASLSAQPSYVLRALGRSDRLAQSSLRLSLGRFSTEADVDRAAARIGNELRRLRAGEPANVESSGFPVDPRYVAEVRRRFEGLAGWGTLPASAATTTGQAGNREHGAEVEVALQLERGQIVEARFRAFGCPHLLAAASWAMERITGLAAEQAAAWDWAEAARALDVPPAKFGRLITLQDAIRAALRNWSGATRSTV
jgi:cysteine desulfurase